MTKQTRFLLPVMFVSLTLTTLMMAQTETVLYTFPMAPNGLADGNPYAGPILDAKGNLFGTTVDGGAYCQGSVFELSPGANGFWTEKDLHSFNSSAKDGVQPFSSLTFDPYGNLYGTTYIGGAYNLGTVFQIHPNQDGSWSEKILHSFNADGTDGYNPYANLIFDKSGNLYGTTYSGGNQRGNGTVFELSPEKNGTWRERVVLNFNYTNGSAPYGGLVFDSVGRLYGTTQYGGTYQHGVVFAMKRGSNGTWTEYVLHNFDPATGDGWAPYAGLVIDGAGHLYGTTLYGGSTTGTVFEVAVVNGKVREKVIHSFINGQDGVFPYGPLAIDSSGNLYGTTWQSLINNVGGGGIVFKLSQTSPNVWQETILHNFVNPADGGNPYSGVALDSTGQIYGTTYAGGISAGTVFQIAP